ncbi:MAG: aldo/keto reductase family protein [Anaerolineae bacterium]|jgi:voltage-dependent potassium channel beta subunit|nr:aldo/keto reductase [Chloroflexota bacterium]
MQFRRLGDAGIKFSVVGLGGWTTFGDSITAESDVREIILAAYEAGVNFFDSADAYARGESERIMGRALAELPRDNLVISSKLFWPMSSDVNDRGLSRKHIMQSIDGTLKRLGTDYLDVYFCHRYDPETPLEETVRAMDDLVHQGKILYWGTSEWTAAQIAEAVGLARAHNLYAPKAEQPGYNLVRRRRVESEIIPAVRQHGIGLTVFSPLASGVLTGKYDDGVPAGSRAARNQGLRDTLTEERLAAVRALKGIADDLGVTRAQLALAWVLRNAEVTSVITGATRAEQVAGNVRASDITLTQAQLDEIDALFPAL